MTPLELLEVLWRDFTASAPQAEDIRYVLTARGEIVCNDRVTLRSYGAPGIGIDALARPFVRLGWRPRERCELRDQHVRARSWRHDDTALPEVVISELTIEELSPGAQAVIGALVGQLPAQFGERDDLPWAGRPWCVSHAQYCTLLAESAYAAWLAAFGFRVHGVAVDVGALSTFPDLAALAAFLVEHGFLLDDLGAIRGSLAERSASVPERIAVAFSDATVAIPGCRYEFTERHGAPGGELRHGESGASTAAPPVMGTT